MQDLRTISLFVFFLISTTLTSCELAEGIFKAGFWIGVVVVVLIIILVLWLIRKFRK